MKNSWRKIFDIKNPHEMQQSPIWSPNRNPNSMFVIPTDGKLLEASTSKSMMDITFNRLWRVKFILFEKIYLSIEMTGYKFG